MPTPEVAVLSLLKDVVSKENPEMEFTIEENWLIIDRNDLPALEDGFFVVECEGGLLSVFHIAEHASTPALQANLCRTNFAKIEMNEPDSLENLTDVLREIEINCSDDWLEA